MHHICGQIQNCKLMALQGNAFSRLRTWMLPSHRPELKFKLCPWECVEKQTRSRSEIWPCPKHYSVTCSPPHPPRYPSAPSTLDLEIFWINQVVWGSKPVNMMGFPPCLQEAFPTSPFIHQEDSCQILPDSAQGGHVSSPPPLSHSPFRFAGHFCTHL